MGSSRTKPTIRQKLFGNITKSVKVLISNGRHQPISPRCLNFSWWRPRKRCDCARNDHKVRAVLVEVSYEAITGSTSAGVRPTSSSIGPVTPTICAIRFTFFSPSFAVLLPFDPSPVALCVDCAARGSPSLPIRRSICEAVGE